MITERMAEHIAAAERAQAWLRQHGARVVGCRLHRCRPVLEIVCPPAELTAAAARITETCHGGTRSVWVASVNDCRIIWR